MYEMRCQSRFNARCWMLGAGALGRPRGMIWRGRREAGSGWGTHVYLWRIHFDIWQNQYNIVKFKNKMKLKNKKESSPAPQFKSINSSVLNLLYCPIFTSIHVSEVSKVAQSCPTLCDPMDCSLPGLSAIGFCRQEYWSGSPFPSPMHESKK